MTAVATLCAQLHVIEYHVRSQRGNCSAGGKSTTLPAAIVCGGAAGAGHLLCDSLQPVQILQQWLVDNDLMDRPGSAWGP